AKGKAKGKAVAKDKQSPTSATKGNAKSKSTVKETRTVKRPEKQSDSRCTPMKFRAVYDKLSDEKKDLVDEMGLGAFQHLPNDYINHKILNELVWSYDVFTNKISTGVGEFLITSEKVNCLRRNKRISKTSLMMKKEALKLFKGKSLIFVQNMVKYCPIGTELERRTFKRAFGLFIQKAFLLPTSSHYISPIHLPIIRDVDNTRRRNWAHHVNNSFLIEGIKEYQEKGSQAVKGCHFILQIIYFKERYEGNNLNDPNTPPPWIQRWCGDNLKEKIRAEDEDITGLIQRAKMRARRKKEGRKRQEGNDKEQTEESESLGSESDEDMEEEEYQTTDSEPEPETEVQCERRSKKKEDDSGNLINLLLVRAGYHSLLTKATKTKPEQRSWLPKYIKIHEQPNPFDCGTFVMKWMEVLDPTKLAANKKYDIEDWTTEKLEEFRNEIISAIILSKSNKLIEGAIQGAMETTIHKPSAALQSPYVQVTTEELKKLG
ncbi:hypothetical protein PIB30_087301, partial [Stylosanthes scabra]|nr:hypothetical protein [Stylosanthes scabra]